MKIMGFSLIGVCVLVICGLLINNHVLWFIIDLLVVLVSGTCGFLLLRKK